MAILLNNLSFFLLEGWRGFSRNGVLNLVATAIVTISLVVLGIFLAGILVANHMVDVVRSKLDVSVYVDQELSDWKAKVLAQEMAQIEGVAKVEYLSKAAAWQRFQRDFQERLGLTENIRENPLPNTFMIKVKDPALAASISKQVAQMSIVSEVRYSGQLAERVHLLAKTFRWVSLFFIVLLGFAILLIVVNTIRLTVIARQADIDIMRLVGATDGFVKGPFLVEGLMMGFIGSTCSFLLLKFLFDVLLTRLQMFLPFLSLQDRAHELYLVHLVTTGVGLILGVLGGYISISKSLKRI